MIERKAFLQITKALILGLRGGLTDPSVSIKQNIIVELAGILEVERCVIFKIGMEETGGCPGETCEIVAGVPLEEYGLEFRVKGPLETHPDIKRAVESGQVLVVEDPRNDNRTAYFKDMVERKGISQIVYVPLFIEEDGRPEGVIVIDAVHGRRFTEDEILFCSEVAELLSLLFGQERVMLQRLRDAIVNRLVPLGGFARRLRENLQTTLDYIEIIQKEAVEISSMLPKKLNGGL